MKIPIIKDPLCPFCKDDIDDISFMESENFRVIYNYAPILPGHSLVIPKSHVESLLGLTEEQISELVNLSTKAAKAIIRIFNAESFNWTVQEKPAAGQSVPHLHLHIIPRKDGDLPQPGDWYPNLQESEKSEHIDSASRKKFSREEVVKIVTDIKKKLSI